MAAESFICNMEPWAGQRSEQAHAIGVRLAEQSEDSESVALLHQYHAVSLVQQGYVGRAMDQIQFACEMLETEVIGGAAYLGWTRMFLAAFDAYRHGWHVGVKEIEAVVADAQARDDLSLEAHTILGLGIQRGLIMGDPDAAQAEVDRIWARWPAEGDLQDFYRVICQVQIHCYRGQWEAAWGLVLASRGVVKSSGALNSGANHCMWATAGAAAAIGALAHGSGDRTARSMLDRWIRGQLSRAGWHQVWGELSLSSRCELDGDIAGAVAATERAMHAAQSERMVAMLPLGEMRTAHLTNNPDDCQRAVELMKQQGLVDPERFAQLYTPEIPLAT
jgi:hypothetical protein